jgi:DNA-binding response OmpR family regulator
MIAADRAQAHAILVVDDNDDIREALEISLGSHGFAVAAAGDALTALRRMQDGFDPCVILLDLHMPGLSGWHVLDHKDDDRDRTDVAVIVVSGDPEQRTRVLGRGCEFLLKPVRPETLFATIERRCARHGLAGPRSAPAATGALRTLPG